MTKTYIKYDLSLSTLYSYLTLYVTDGCDTILRFGLGSFNPHFREDEIVMGGGEEYNLFTPEMRGEIQKLFPLSFFLTD
jgi:hypothetical protein